MKILFTGGTGFLGRNLLPELKKKYDVYSPTRNELNLCDFDAVQKCIAENHYDVVIHAAIPNLLPGKDDKNNLFQDSLRAYMNLYNQRNKFGKMIYFGSGAEFDKNYDICNVTETEFGNKIPTSDYGFGKFIMNSLCRNSNNVVNLRIFGCFGPTDADFKFMTSVIRDCLLKNTVTLKQNCFFDYIYITDLLNILLYFIEHDSKYSDYNISSGRRFELKDLANNIIKKIGNKNQLLITTEGYGKEYTAVNDRLINEYKDLRFLSIDKAIDLQIEYEKGVLKL